jgi:hypothetical protein
MFNSSHFISWLHLNTIQGLGSYTEKLLCGFLDVCLVIV